MSRPNLVIVMPDQFRQQSLGCWRLPEFEGLLRGAADPVQTPHLDAFARQSLLLHRASATAPVCSPFRGMFFSGRFPEANGVAHNCGHDRPDCYLRPTVTCLTDVLAAAGYDCGYIGKLHLDFPHQFESTRPDWYPGGWDVYTPAERRHGCRFWHSYGTFDVHKNPHYWDADGERHDPQRWSPSYEADVASAYIRNEDGQRPADQPFALTVAMNPPHTPNESLEDCEEEDYRLYADRPCEELVNRPNVDDAAATCEAAKFYFAQVSGVDRAFGQILQAIEDSGQADRTIVLFLSDHGELLGSHGRRGKNQIYAESFRIPCLLRAPGLRPGHDPLQITAVDFMPTLLGLLGQRQEIPDGVAGVDYSPLWLRDAPMPERPDAALFMRNVPGPQDDQGLHRGYRGVARGVTTAHHTLLIDDPYADEGPRIQIFDDDRDPYQQQSLPWRERPDLARELFAHCARLLRRADDPWYHGGVLRGTLPYDEV